MPRGYSYQFKQKERRMVLRHVVGIRHLLACVPLLLTAGCLSLGGKTTYVQESAETPARLASLEARVSALEQALSLGPTPVIPAPGAP